jgi:hypothetical protein
MGHTVKLIAPQFVKPFYYPDLKGFARLSDPFPKLLPLL